LPVLRQKARGMIGDDLDLQERLHDRAVAQNNGRVVKETPASLLDSLRTGAWLQAQTFPALAYAIPGVVPEGLTFNCGPPKIGKSWELLDFALALSCGGVAFGHLPVGDPRPTLYLALEDGDRRLQDRCRKLLQGGPIPGRLHYMTRIEPGRVLDTAEEWLSLYPDERPVLMLDTLGKANPPAAYGESPYDRDYRIGTALKLLADQVEGASVIVNHHDRKAGGDDFVHAVSGTNGLAGAADTLIIISRPRLQPEGKIQVTGRDVAEREYALTFTEGCQWVLSGGSLDAAATQADRVRNAAGLGDRSLEVLDFVSGRSKGVTPKEVADALNLPDARRYLARLFDSGRVSKGGRGLYTPVSTVPMSQPAEDLSRHCDSGDTRLDRESIRARGADAADIPANPMGYGQ
jgi:hypothetical protein